MSEFGIQDDEAFAPVSTRESLVMSIQFEPVNVCRAAALATLLQRNRRAFLAPGEEMRRGQWWPMYEVLIEDDVLFDRLDSR